MAIDRNQASVHLGGLESDAPLGAGDAGQRGVPAALSDLIRQGSTWRGPSLHKLEDPQGRFSEFDFERPRGVLPLVAATARMEARGDR